MPYSQLERRDAARLALAMIESRTLASRRSILTRTLRRTTSKEVGSLDAEHGMTAPVAPDVRTASAGAEA